MHYQYAGYTLRDLAEAGVINASVINLPDFSKNYKIEIGGEYYRLVPAYSFNEKGIKKKHRQELKAEFGDDFALLPYYVSRGITAPIIHDCVYFMTISVKRFFRSLRFFAKGTFVKEKLNEVRDPKSPARVAIKEWLLEYLKTNISGQKIGIELNEAYEGYKELDKLLDIIAQAIYIGFSEDISLLKTNSQPHFIARQKYAELQNAMKTAKRDKKSEYVLRRIALITAMQTLSSVERTLMNHEILENRADPKKYEKAYFVSGKRNALLFDLAGKFANEERLSIRRDITIKRIDVRGILYELASEIFKGAAITLFAQAEQKGKIRYKDMLKPATNASGEVSLTELRTAQYNILQMFIFNNRVDKVGNSIGGIKMAEKIALAAMRRMELMGVSEFTVDQKKTKLIAFPMPDNFKGDVGQYRQYLKALDMQQVVSEVFTRSVRVLAISESHDEVFKRALDIYNIAKVELKERFSGFKKTQGFAAVKDEFSILSDSISVVRFGTRGKRTMNATLLELREKMFEMSKFAGKVTSNRADVTHLSPPNTTGVGSSGSAVPAGKLNVSKPGVEIAVAAVH